MKSRVFMISVLFVLNATACTPGSDLSGSQNLETMQENAALSQIPSFITVEENGATRFDASSLETLVADMPTGTLSADEKAGLIMMREEEKLAHDVYLKLYEKWQYRAFSNIAQSEQTHTEAVKVLLDKYQLTDPVGDHDVGEFTNSDMAKLYQELLASGEESLTAALKIGAKIEDLDIKDLQVEVAKTDQEDIKMVYEELMRGSRNHMRAFTKGLTNQGETYTPEYITQSEYDAIIAADMERGSSMAQGSGMGNGPRNGSGNGGGPARFR